MGRGEFRTASKRGRSHGEEALRHQAPAATCLLSQRDAHLPPSTLSILRSFFRASRSAVTPWHGYAPTANPMEWTSHQRSTVTRASSTNAIREYRGRREHRYPHVLNKLHATGEPVITDAAKAWEGWGLGPCKNPRGSSSSLREKPRGPLVDNRKVSMARAR